MQFRFRPVVDVEERRKLRPVVGDIVLFERKKYRVTETGLKYLRVEAVDNPRDKGIVKVQEVSKWFPEDELNEAPEPLENLDES